MRVRLAIWPIIFVTEPSDRGDRMNTPWLDKIASLTPETIKIIVDKGTEYPFSGQYNAVATHGTYLCRRCGWALFRANSQFHSGCGWPSFDHEISGRIARHPDPDGHRTEITCARCHGHLGHVFIGEHLTKNNLRHCVNAASIDFAHSDQVDDTREIIVAGGCFWGIDYLFRQLPGVVQVESGYTGGHMASPSYQQVCQGHSGHYEAVRVVFDQSHLNDERVLKYFFEIHDSTQENGQGPDIGPQYQSAVFFYALEQKTTTTHLIEILQGLGYSVATKILPVSTFWPAEAYHQDYHHHNKQPYCHRRVKRFE